MIFFLIHKCRLVAIRFFFFLFLLNAYHLSAYNLGILVPTCCRDPCTKLGGIKKHRGGGNRWNWRSRILFHNIIDLKKIFWKTLITQLKKMGSPFVLPNLDRSQVAVQWKSDFLVVNSRNLIVPQPKKFDENYLNFQHTEKLSWNVFPLQPWLYGVDKE